MKNLVKLKIGPLKIAGFSFRAGQLLDVTIPLVNFRIRVPPVDIKFWDPTTILPETTIIVPPLTIEEITELLPKIADFVFSQAQPYLDRLAEDYYRAHSEEKI